MPNYMIYYQVHWSNGLESVRRSISDIHTSLIKVTTVLSGEEAARAFLKSQVCNSSILVWTLIIFNKVVIF